MVKGTKSKSGKSIDIEEYRKLVAMHAWKAWRRLPKHLQNWIEVQDMIEDGMAEAYRLTYTYNPKWASFSTALYSRMHGFYINHYLEFHSTQERGWVKVSKDHKQRWKNMKPIPHASLQAMEYHFKRNNDSATLDDVVGHIPALVVSADTITDNVYTQCDVIPSLMKVYNDASPRLQGHFVEWFTLVPMSKIVIKDREAQLIDTVRVRHKGDRFRESAKEFRCLCKIQEITYRDCLHIIRSPGCLDTLSRNLLGTPRDLNFPCPIVERVL